MHHTIIQTILALTLVTLCLGTQDNSEVHLLDDNSDFYGFGRSLLQNDGAAVEPFIDQSWFGHHRELLAPGSHDSSLPRDRREFYRFGRSQLPFEEKRFLRFGRSVHPSATDSKLHAHDQFKKSLYRRRRSTENGSQSVKLSHHLKRSVQSNDPTDDPKNNQENKIHHKREVSTLNGERDNSVISNDVLGEYQEADKRFMRFGKRFMRFGRGNEDTDEYEKRFMRFGRGNEDNSGYEKRFMRFSKGFDADQGFDKRFMRFGKRFMRFGRGNKDEENNEKRFMRFGKSVDYNEEPEKRFMRFGKGMGNNEDPEKRFMRFGKRFMRFGRQGEEHDNQILDLYNDSDDVNAGHLEKSSR